MNTGNYMTEYTEREPRVWGWCHACRAPIYENEEYYEIGGSAYCKECVKQKDAEREEE